MNFKLVARLLIAGVFFITAQGAFAANNCKLLYNTDMLHVHEAITACMANGGSLGDCKNEPDILAMAEDAAFDWSGCQSMIRDGGMPVFPSDPNFTCYYTYNPNTGDIELLECYAASLKIPKLGIPGFDKEEPTLARYTPRMMDFRQLLRDGIAARLNFPAVRNTEHSVWNQISAS